MSKEAMKLALDALEKLWNIIDDIDTYGDMAKADEELYRSLVERRQRTRFEETGISTDGYTLDGGAITALREALAEQPAQQEAKIVRWNCPCGNKYTFHGFTKAPPQRTWVGLTDDEITDIWAEASPYYHEDDFARAIEAKLKEKNI